jgi:1-acyl-sn-glycerol-3-phosphate acyltransferase
MIEAVLIGLVRLLTGAVVRSQGFTFEPVQQRIYYANHTSHLDTLLIWSLIPREQRRQVHPAAAQDYWWTSRWRRYLAEQVFRAVPVVRQRNAASEEDPLQAVESVLARGDSLIFFPEGTRGSGTGVQRFRSGLYQLARQSPGVVMVPVFISNLNRVLPKGEFLPVPVICTVTFGAGITLDADEPRAAFIARAQAELQALSGT